MNTLNLENGRLKIVTKLSMISTILSKTTKYIARDFELRGTLIANAVKCSNIFPCHIYHVQRSRSFVTSTSKLIVAPKQMPNIMLIRGKKSLIRMKSKPSVKAHRILKTKKSAAKRFKITGTGKLKFRHAGKVP